MTDVRDSSRFEFAPQAVIRAAGWPVEVLDSFGDSELASLALRSRKCGAAFATYADAYDRVLQKEREALWQRTAEDSRFMKALLLSNPSVAGRVRRFASRRSVRNKSIRHLETTLYRYLARAAGRSVPNALWARVGLVQFADEEGTLPTPNRYSFSPDLRPFQSILRSLGRRPNYRKEALWRANPTLARQPDGAYRYWSRTANGPLVHREVQQNDLVDVVLNTLKWLGSATFSQIIEAAEASPCGEPASTEDLQATLDAIADAGVLVGGLDLPSRFTTAWEALTAVEPQLANDGRSAWNRCVREVSSICDELAAGLDAMTFQSVEDLVRRASEAMEDLAHGLELPLPILPSPFLRCDAGLPYDLRLSAEQKRVLVQALNAYEDHWINGLSPAAALREDLRRTFAASVKGGVALERLNCDCVAASALSGGFVDDLSRAADASVTGRLAEWDACLRDSRPEVALDLRAGLDQEPAPASPFGCGYVSIFEPFQVAVHGIGEDPARAFARHSGLLDIGRLQAWLSGHLRDVSLRHAIQIAELQVPFEQNPNVLAAPDFGALPIELWGASPDTLPLRGAMLYLDPVSRMPFLSLPSVRQPIAVFCFASANIGATDPFSRQLLWTAFQDTPLPNFRASALTLPIELESPRFTPRVRLPGGAILRCRRTVLSGQRLNDLARASVVNRYAEWQRLAEEQNWPELVIVQRDDEPGLLINRNSPLALESVFKGVRDHVTSLIVEELPGTPWLRGGDGRHYMAELSLAFVRRTHGWSSRGQPDVDMTSAPGPEPKLARPEDQRARA